MLKLSIRIAVLCMLIKVGAGGTALAQPPASSPGVTRDRITIGSLQDLSGPLAGFGNAVKNGMTMRVEEINDSGGIHNRQLKLRIEDSAYDPQQALAATQKLLQHDKIFAMVGSLGTAVAMASFAPLFEQNVLHVFPLSAAREMYRPFHRLKFLFTAPYYDQMRTAVKWMAKERSAKKFCAIYQDDDFGREVIEGAEQGLKEIGNRFVEKTRFPRGATDFSAQVRTMQVAGCDTVVLGAVIRETLGAIGMARKLGWTPQFIGSSAAYTDLIHKLGGGTAMDGLYAVHQVAVPYTDDAARTVRQWAARYKTRFKEEPSLFSAYGYVAIDMFYRTALAAGPQLGTDNFVKTLETTPLPRDMFGSPEYRFSATQHLGNQRSRIAQIRNGRWVSITDYLDVD